VIVNLKRGVIMK